MSTTMKRYILLIATALMAVSMSAADLTGKRIYVNPGHGSFGPNDRPCATIPYPALSSTGMPDTCGFYESNTDLWKCLYLGKKLEAAGATVLYSRTECGPWPYEKVNGQYPDYTYDDYKALPDYTKYNRNLSEICEEVESNNIDYFISVHSNAATEGTTTNYPLFLMRGLDKDKRGDATSPHDFVEGSYERAAACWAYRYGIMASGIDPASYYSMTSMNIRGDVSFMGSGSEATRTNGQKYYGYYGVLKHGAPGFLVEGYFHTYQPARHRALNHDYCHQEGLAYYRGIVDYYGADKEKVGYIMGTVKDLHRKMNNPLFNYAPKTNDQWIPCNGAEVTLLKGGVEVAKYNVDTLYNGIFVFENLTPGDDYTLDATCKGYYPLTDDQKVRFSVKANETTYQMIYLSDTSYVPPTVVYYNYPEPEQPAYLQLASTYEMKQSFVGKKLADVLADKTVRRVLYRNGNMYVLAVDAAKEPTLIEVDAEKQTVLHTLPTDFCSVVSADGYKLSDITFTADGYLVGCNYEHTAFDATQAAKYGEGTHNDWNVYQWESNAAGWAGKLWFAHKNNETSGNYYNAMTGITLAYSGTTLDGFIVTTATTTGDSHNTRLPIISISDGALAGALRNHPADNFSTNEYGEPQFVVSPRDDKNIIITSAKKTPVEYTLTMTTASAITPAGTFAVHTTGANYFKYAHRDMMVAPAEDAEGKSTGVALYDITDGLDKAALIKTTNTTLDAADATYTMAAGVVKDADITLYLVRDSLISKFTTIGVDQPATPAIMARNLNVTKAEETYTFTFDANQDAVNANLVFYDAATNDYVGKVAISNIKEGANTATVNAIDLPGDHGQALTWAVELEGKTIGNVGKLFEDKSLIATETSRLFNAVDNNPESDKFGHIYVFHRAGSSASALKVNSGLFEYDENYNKLNTEKYNGGETFGNPTRISLDDEGYLYIADWSDNHSGVFVANTADLSKPFTQFFQGTRDGSGIFTNNGAAVGSSTPGCNIFGHGANTKLLVYNEDASGTLPANGAVVYNIGQTDGSILRTWGEAPSAVYTLTGQLNSEGNVWGTSHGFFVSQHRTEGGNNGSATSLKFYDFNGEEQFSSASDDYKDIITGSNGSGYAVSADESMLVLQGGSSQFYVFDITWEGDKPVLTLRYEYKHGVSVFRQMNFDYAGNLVCTGDNGMYIFSLPGENITTIPAHKALTVEGTAYRVKTITLNVNDTTLLVGEDFQLTAAVAPENATYPEVTWASDNEAVATVVDGKVTAVAGGNANITATADGIVATCKVSVAVPVTAVKLSQTEVTLNILDTIVLTATVLPENATDKSVTWSSSNEAVATVIDGKVTALTEGEASIVVKTNDGGFTDTCKVVVKIPFIHVTSVTLDKTEITLHVEETTTLTATILPEAAMDKSVTWSSSNDEVATVSEGVVTAVAEGTATITVTTTDGGLTATCAVTVKLTDGVLNIRILDVDAPMYDVMGRQVDNTYKGIVIQNGHKYLLR